MAWKKNRHLVAEGFGDLAYLPRGSSGWDCTLAAMAFAVRRKIDRRSPDLNAWAARHCLPASASHPLSAESPGPIEGPESAGPPAGGS